MDFTGSRLVMQRERLPFLAEQKETPELSPLIKTQPTYNCLKSPLDTSKMFNYDHYSSLMFINVHTMIIKAKG
jgi:hypothetical protein